MPCMTETVYLPKELRGVTILIEQQEGTWGLTDYFLGSNATGVDYRRTKDLGDRATSAANFGDLVNGVDEGDGWVRCQITKAENEVTADSPKSEWEISLSPRSMLN